MIKKYRMLEKAEKQAIEVQQDDRLIIKEMGENRITNTDYYYSVRLIGSKGSRHVVRKSCIYDARVATIKLAHELQLPFSTKILKRDKKSALQYSDEEI